MTWSLIARDGEEIGLIVASKFFACGAIVPYVGARTAVASQAFCNPIWGTEGRARLETESAEQVLADLVARDDGRAIRQAHMMDATGNFAAHTGAECVDWCGHLIRSEHSVAGNMLAGPEVIHATSDAYAASTGPFVERLIAAMRAGEAAGGDKRGRQAAGLTIHRGQDHPWLSLRADDHADPLGELDRLWRVAQERYVHFTLGIPTRDAFSGSPTREHIDAAIAESDARRLASGQPSLSHAVDQ
ncbi:Uncharacterized conserved protein, Ntn-hydrolase superfamily [Jannaschia faecimaris]|uniref:Uncharacterized conserved protein, Ntn-hydrolase superfamily n=1 Tax=Jannaschia faecimaris TaxID=1244108 RepID=A0A1H3TF40_9RHOB|nr:DUF1028 domain-containing protein [Jannaschia faecimaris]SDZ48508.1 Uncharacterized conserved protein, Ntn-hydrolase superfamily [Jannaschia faecimaris]